MPTTNYYSVGDRILGQERSGTRVDYLPNALGSVVATADQAKNVVHTASYKPFGSLLNGTGEDPDFGWVGTLGYRDQKLAHSKYYVRARHFSSDEGNWRSVDPLWPSQLPYAYAIGDPITVSDPSGLAPCGVPCTATDDEICAEAKRIGMDINKRDGNADDGGVICCNGRPIACFWGTPNKGGPLIKKCVEAHERVHFKQTPPCDPRGMYRNEFPDNTSNELAEYYECLASITELECLRDALKGCSKLKGEAKTACEIAYNQEIFEICSQIRDPKSDRTCPLFVDLSACKGFM